MNSPKTNRLLHRLVLAPWRWIVNRLRGSVASGRSRGCCPLCEGRGETKIDLGEIITVACPQCQGSGRENE